MYNLEGETSLSLGAWNRFIPGDKLRRCHGYTTSHSSLDRVLSFLPVLLVFAGRGVLREEKLHLFCLMSSFVNPVHDSQDQ